MIRKMTQEKMENGGSAIIHLENVKNSLIGSSACLDGWGELPTVNSFLVFLCLMNHDSKCHFSLREAEMSSTLTFAIFPIWGSGHIT